LNEIQVKHAFDVLADAELRDAYDRLGEPGVKVATQGVIDHKYIVIQMLVSYTSTLILAFLMTFSEPSGDAIGVSLFGMLGDFFNRYFSLCF
jgi:DnaJ-class molecular chaperone